MTQKDSIETREMLTSVLQSWHSDTVLREITTNKALDNIDKHLEKLNSKVAEHEKIININLPHSVNNCVQNDTIQEIRDNMISGKSVRNAIYKSIAATGVLASILFILFKLFIEK